MSLIWKNFIKDPRFKLYKQTCKCIIIGKRSGFPAFCSLHYFWKSRATTSLMSGHVWHAGVTTEEIWCLLPFSTIKNPSLRRCHSAVTVFGWLCGLSNTTTVQKSPSQNTACAWFSHAMHKTRLSYYWKKNQRPIAHWKTRMLPFMVEEKALVNVTDWPAHKKAVVKNQEVEMEF